MNSPTGAALDTSHDQTPAGTDRTPVVVRSADGSIAAGARAGHLTDQLGLPADGGTGQSEGLVLWVAAEGLALGFAAEPVERALVLEFGVDRRGATAGRGPASLLLARAVGVDRGVKRVVDATAGFGRDAIALARRGVEVVMIERDPVLAVLLADALHRLEATDSRLAARLHLLPGDACGLLADRAHPLLCEPIDAIYLDPMFPATGKTALPRRDLQLLRALLGQGGEDAVALLACARQVARRRVVVKRPPHAPALVERPLAHHGGSRVRYDIYAPLADGGHPSAT